MRWLGGIGGRKCGGGWFDWLGTTELTYVEQARQTILGGARESVLFAYGGLQGTTGPNDIALFRTNLPNLFEVASQVHRRVPVGIAAYKPVNSAPETEAHVFDFAGMLGLPLMPCHQFPTNATAAFFSLHALKDPGFTNKFLNFVLSGRQVLITDGLARRLGPVVPVNARNVHVLPVRGNPAQLLNLTPAELSRLRAPMLAPFQVVFEAPAKISLYLFEDGSYVVENFRDELEDVSLNKVVTTLTPRDWYCQWR
jgi:hypothetical protein